MFGWLSTVKYSDKYDRIILFRNYILILISQHSYLRKNPIKIGNFFVSYLNMIFKYEED